jgi:hypothetical protein
MCGTDVVQICSHNLPLAVSLPNLVRSSFKAKPATLILIGSFFFRWGESPTVSGAKAAHFL